MRRCFIVCGKVALLIIPLLIISGCGPGPAPQPRESKIQAELTATEAGVKVFGEETSETEVQQDETVKVSVDDRIEVDMGSRAMLQFPDFLEVELFRNAKVRLTDAKLESGGSLFVSLNQIQGHIWVSLTDQPLARLALETDIATMKTLQEGTQFVVCQAPGKLTCLWVDHGAVEITAQGTKQIVRSGRATYVLKGQAPVPALCAPARIFAGWRDEFRSSADTPAISQLVNALPQQPCISEMVKIGSGTYEIGRGQGDESHSAVRNIVLEDFRIDVNEVTNAQYEHYLDQTGDQEPAVWPDEGDHPVRGVTWDQASAYCGWAGKRLPAEAEWETAARGTGQNPRLFPWGDDPEADGQITDLPLEDTYSVGSISFNVSPLGAYDMAGNVWEWVGEPYDSVQEGYRILRGGRFGFIRDLSFRQEAASNDERFVPYSGFRCAADKLEE